MLEQNIITRKQNSILWTDINFARERHLNAWEQNSNAWKWNGPTK